MTAILLSGIPGSGKTELSKTLHSTYGYSIVDPDQLKEIGVSVKRSDELFPKRLTQKISQHTNIIVDMTGRHESFYREMVEQLEAAGYHVIMIYVYMNDVDVAVKRIQNRKRSVDVDYLEATNRKLNAIYPFYKKFFSSVNNRDFILFNGFMDINSNEYQQNISRLYKTINIAIRKYEDRKKENLKLSRFTRFIRQQNESEESQNTSGFEQLSLLTFENMNQIKEFLQSQNKELYNIYDSGEYGFLFRGSNKYKEYYEMGAAKTKRGYFCFKGIAPQSRQSLNTLDSVNKAINQILVSDYGAKAHRNNSVFITPKLDDLSKYVGDPVNSYSTGVIFPIAGKFSITFLSFLDLYDDLYRNIFTSQKSRRVFPKVMETSSLVRDLVRENFNEIQDEFRESGYRFNTTYFEQAVKSLIDDKAFHRNFPQITLAYNIIIHYAESGNEKAKKFVDKYALNLDSVDSFKEFLMQIDTTALKEFLGGVSVSNKLSIEEMKNISGEVYLTGEYIVIPYKIAENLFPIDYEGDYDDEEDFYYDVEDDEEGEENDEY